MMAFSVHGNRQVYLIMYKVLSSGPDSINIAEITDPSSSCKQLGIEPASYKWVVRCLHSGHPAVSLHPAKLGKKRHKRGATEGRWSLWTASMMFGSCRVLRALLGSSQLPVSF